MESVSVSDNVGDSDRESQPLILSSTSATMISSLLLRLALDELVSGGLCNAPSPAVSSEELRHLHGDLNEGDV